MLRPPKGIKQYALAKQSGIVDKREPVQLIDITMPQTKPSEIITVTYEVSESIQIVIPP